MEEPAAETLAGIAEGAQSPAGPAEVGQTAAEEHLAGVAAPTAAAEAPVLVVGAAKLVVVAAEQQTVVEAVAVEEEIVVAVVVVGVALAVVVAGVGQAVVAAVAVPLAGPFAVLYPFSFWIVVAGVGRPMVPLGVQVVGVPAAAVRSWAGVPVVAVGVGHQMEFALWVFLFL